MTEYTLDATNKSLGRLASEAAIILRGKNKPDFLPYVKPTQKVIIVNAGLVKITGLKEEQKKYTRHSGYPGGLKTNTLADLRTKFGIGRVIEKAIYGMLPSNRLRALMMKNLTIKE